MHIGEEVKPLHIRDGHVLDVHHRADDEQRQPEGAAVEAVDPHVVEVEVDQRRVGDDVGHSDPRAHRQNGHHHVQPVPICLDEAQLKKYVEKSPHWSSKLQTDLEITNDDNSRKAHGACLLESVEHAVVDIWICEEIKRQDGAQHALEHGLQHPGPEDSSLDEKRQHKLKSTATQV